MVKVLISDLFGVHLHRNEDQMKSNFSQVSGLTPDIVARAIKESGREALKVGQMQPEEYVANLNTHLKTGLSTEQVQEIWNRSLRADEQMVALLHRVHEQGVRVLLLSNLNAFDQAGAFQKGLSTFESVLSYQVGFKKPDERIFRLALSDNLPSDCLYMDDQMKNVHVAERLGMMAHQFKSYDKLIEALRKCGITCV